MQLYESIRCEHGSYVNDDGEVVPTIKYYLRLEGEPEERLVMTNVGYPVVTET